MRGFSIANSKTKVCNGSSCQWGLVNYACDIGSVSLSVSSPLTIQNTDMGHYSVLEPVAVTAHAAVGLLTVLLSAPTEVGKQS